MRVRLARKGLEQESGRGRPAGASDEEGWGEAAGVRADPA